MGLLSDMISVVAPVYNEADAIEEFIRRTNAVMQQHYSHYEILLVDDGSTDNTLQLMRAAAMHNPHLRILVFSRNYGHEIAMTAGIEHACGEWVVLMDSDLQNPPEFIPQLINKAREGFDVVYARRNKRLGESRLKRMTSKLFYWLARKMTGFNLPSDAGDFRVLKRPVVDSLCQLQEVDRYLMMLYAYVGFSTSFVPYDCQPRFAGSTKYSYRKMINLALDAIVCFSHRPLRYMATASVIISLFLFGYSGFIIVQKLLVNNLVPGVASLLCVVSGLFAVLFLFLALLSEYIGRTLTESKRRPLYYVRAKINF